MHNLHKISKNKTNICSLLILWQYLHANIFLLDFLYSSSRQVSSFLFKLYISLLLSKVNILCMFTQGCNMRRICVLWLHYVKIRINKLKLYLLKVIIKCSNILNLYFINYAKLKNSGLKLKWNMHFFYCSGKFLQYPLIITLAEFLLINSLHCLY